MIDHLNVTIQNTHAQLQQSLQQLVAEGTVTVQPDTMATQQYPGATPIQSHQAPPVVQQYYSSPVPPNDMVVRKQVCVFWAYQKFKLAALVSDYLRHFRILL